MNLYGIITAVATFIIIGLFHPLVIKAEYHLGTGCWWIFCIAGLLFIVGRPICTMFGADSNTLEFTLSCMPKYAWGFSVMALNTVISAYLYSTKRSVQAIVMNILRSFVLDLAAIILLPELFGQEIIWHSFGIYELAVLLVAVILVRRSEKNGVVFR